MPWLGHSFTCPVGTQLFDMSWSGSSYSTFPERGIVFTTCPDCDVVLWHVLVRTQFYDISGSGHSYSTCTGWDAVLRHTVVNYLIISSMKRMPIKPLNYSMSVIITYVYIINVFFLSVLYFILGTFLDE